MPKIYLLIVRIIAATIAIGALGGVFVLVAMDNMTKGEVRKIDGYVPWSEETVKLAESLPVLQTNGRVAPLSTQAGFLMLSLHGARSMKIEV